MLRPVCLLSVLSVSLPSACAKSLGAMSSFGPVPTQDCATRPCPLSCSSFTMFPRPPLSTLPAAAPPSTLPNPPGKRSLRLPPGLAPVVAPPGMLPGLPPSNPPRISPRSPPEPPAPRGPAGGKRACRPPPPGGAGRPPPPLGALVGGGPQRPHNDGRHPPPPPAAAGLALAARAIHHTGKDIRQSHVCLLVLMSDAAPSNLAPTASGEVMARWGCPDRERCDERRAYSR